MGLLGLVCQEQKQARNDQHAANQQYGFRKDRFNGIHKEEAN